MHIEDTIYQVQHDILVLEKRLEQIMNLFEGQIYDAVCVSIYSQPKEKDSWDFGIHITVPPIKDLHLSYGSINQKSKLIADVLALSMAVDFLATTQYAVDNQCIIYLSNKTLVTALQSINSRLTKKEKEKLDCLKEKLLQLDILKIEYKHEDSSPQIKKLKKAIEKGKRNVDGGR